MNCKNCKIELAENNGYCHACGARIIKNRLTFKNLMAQAGEEFFNYDNKLLKTLKHLLTRPEDVIDGYIQGIRKKYVNPISFFTISLTLSGLIAFLVSNYFRDDIMLPSFAQGDQSEGLIETQNKTFDFITSYTSLFASLSIPFTALLSYIIFLNKKYNLTEHIILNLYAYSQIAIATFFMALPVVLIAPEYYSFTGLITIPLYFLYYSYIFIKVFDLSFLQYVLKSLLFGGTIFLLIILLGIVMFILMKSGIVDPGQFAPVPPPETPPTN